MREITVKEFNLKDTLECGQTFCWMREGSGYVNTDVGQIVFVEQQGNRLLYDTSESDVDIIKMLRLSDPIGQIQTEIDRDELMHASIQFAPGLRIVADPFFPCLITFLCSIQKNIPAIQTVTQKIRERWGPSYEFRGRVYHGMPEPEVLAKVSSSELREVGLGWRADFINRAARAIAKGEIDESYLRHTSYDEVHAALKSLYGVGDKVADCVSLFSLGHLDAFPIDVWIERVIQSKYNFFSDTGKSYAKKSRAAREYFGKYAGYAQEYLYYYTRNTFQS
ncbi:MAG: DNA-3-methyladenine glycosylase family protein [Candidatus Thorarchaeota archaeon]